MIVELDETWAIIISTLVALLYTIAGGLYSVVLTDVVQLAFIVGGLVRAHRSSVKWVWVGLKCLLEFLKL